MGPGLYIVVLMYLQHISILQYRNPLRPPPQAKLVAAATSNLCESANMMVQGEAEEDKLIVAAKAVAASTAQLLIACQVKADARSENNKRLQVCGCGQWVWLYIINYTVIVHTDSK